MSGIELRLNNGPNVALYPPGASFGPRWSRDYEFVWMVEGEAHYEYESDGATIAAELPEGTLLLCRPQVRDSFVWDKTRRTRHGFFHFHVVSLPGEWPDPDSWPLTRRFGEDDLLPLLCRHLVTWRDSGNPLQQRQAAGLLLAAFVTGETRLGDAPSQTPPDPVQRALDFVYTQLETDPAAPMELDQLARAAFVTPEHLCRIFKASTGHSPLETVRLARLDRAMVLLARSNYSVAQVGTLCGFASAFHFSRAFKAVYGESPREMRRAVEAGAMVPLSPLVRSVTRQVP